MIRVPRSESPFLQTSSDRLGPECKSPSMTRFSILAALVLGSVTPAATAMAQTFPNDEASVRYRQLIQQLPPSERPRPHDPRWTTNAISPSVGRFGLPLSGPVARGGMTAVR